MVDHKPETVFMTKAQLTHGYMKLGWVSWILTLGKNNFNRMIKEGNFLVIMM